MGLLGLGKLESLTPSPQRNWRRTNPVFYLLLAAAFGSIIYLGYFCFLNGSPSRYVYGADSFGNVCGKEDNSRISGVERSGMDMSGNKLLLSLGLDSESGEMKSALCVKSCPTGQMTCGQMLEANGYLQINESLVRKRICEPSATIESFKEFGNRCFPKKVYAGATPAQKGASSKSAWRIQTLRSMFRNEYATGVAPIADRLLAIQESIMVSISIALIYVSEYWVTATWLCVLSTALCFSFITMFLFLPRSAIYLIWLTITSVLCFTTVYLAYHTVLEWPKVQHKSTTGDANTAENGERPDVEFSMSLRLQYLIYSAISAVCTGSLIYVMIKKRIFIAFLVELNFEMARMMRQMTGFYIHPFLTLFFQLAAFVYFGFVLLFLLTINTPTHDLDGMVLYIPRPSLDTLKLLALHVFSCLWLFAFIDGCRKCIIADTVSWFTFFHITDHRSVEFAMTLKSFGHLFNYSLGSVVAGSVIVTLTSLPRFLVAVCTNLLRPWKAFKICERMDSVSSSAYIRVGIFSEDFITAGNRWFKVQKFFAPGTFEILNRNKQLMFLGKLSALCVVTIWLLMWNFVNSPEFSIHVDKLIVGIPALILTYFLVSPFLYFHHTVSESMLLIYCYDQKVNGDIRKPYFVGDRFQNLVGKYFHLLNPYKIKLYERMSGGTTYPIEPARKRRKRPGAAKGKRTNDDGTKSISSTCPSSDEDVNLKSVQVVDSFDRLLDQAVIQQAMSPLYRRDKDDSGKQDRPKSRFPPIVKKQKAPPLVLIPGQIYEYESDEESSKPQTASFGPNNFTKRPVAPQDLMKYLPRDPLTGPPSGSKKSFKTEIETINEFPIQEKSSPRSSSPMDSFQLYTRRVHFWDGARPGNSERVKNAAAEELPHCSLTPPQRINTPFPSPRASYSPMRGAGSPAWN